MKIKIILIKLVTIIIMMTLMIMVSNTVYGDAAGIGSVIGTIQQGGGGGAGGGPVQAIGLILLDVAQAVAAAVAAIMLAMLGIKYVQAAPEEKANIKKHAVIYLVGAVFAFGGIPIVRFMAEIASGWN